MSIREPIGLPVRSLGPWLGPIGIAERRPVLVADCMVDSSGSLEVQDGDGRAEWKRDQ